ncbi:MAG: hypothetical protein ACLP4V_28855 [Methylocella sp.]
MGKNRHKTCRRLNGGNKGWVVGPCQCRQPPQAVAEGQHLQGPTTQAQSATEVDDQVHDINPFQAPTIERNELRAVYARILAAANKSQNGLISMSELTHYIATHVSGLTGGKQHPGVEQRFEGELFITGQQSQKDLVLWRTGIVQAAFASSGFPPLCGSSARSSQ